MDRKSLNMKRLTEVWDKSAKVLQLKKQLHEEQQMLINTDKI